MSIKSFIVAQFKRRTATNFYTEEGIKATVIELLWYLVFLITVTIVAFATRDMSMFYFANTVDRMILQRPFLTDGGTELTYDEIVSIDDWWQFMESSFLDGIHDMDSNEARTKSKRDLDMDMTFLKESVFLGPPRIRQLRVKNGTCKIHREFQRFFRNCYSHYSLMNEDVNKDNDENTMFLWGQFATYRGGGFVENFQNAKSDNAEILKNLKQKLWIGQGTRLIVVEFNLYNANANLFCLVKFFAELPTTGGVLATSSIQAFQLLRIGTAYDCFIVFCKVLFFLQILFYTIREIMEIRVLKWNYFKFFWNWISVIILVIGILSLLFTIIRHAYMATLLSKYNQEPHKYFNMDFIGFWAFQHTNIMAICAFLVWIQIFKYISFNTTMLQFSTTLRRCAFDLLGFGVMFFIVFIAFAQLGYLLFGTENAHFRTLTDSIFTMMRTILGDFDYLAIERANRILGPCFFLTYIFLVFFVLLNMFLAIINDTYSVVKSEITEDNIFLWNYLRKMLSKFCKCLCCGRDIYKYEESEKPTKSNVKLESKPGIEPTSGSDTRPVASGMVVRRKEMLGTIFQVIEPEQTNSINLTQEQLDRFNDRLRNLEILMDNFVFRMNSLVAKLDSNKTRSV